MIDEEVIQAYLQYVRTEPLMIIIGCVATIVVMVSGGMAASVAENRSRGPIKHFLMGLAIPVLYPIICLFAMSVYEPPQAVQVEEEEGEKGQGPPPVEVMPEGVDGELVTAASLDDEQRYNKDYFQNIALDDYGNYRGPFTLRMKTGEEVRIDRIIDCLPVVVVTESISPDGKNAHLRIPYDQVEQCEEL
ncbi:MAG: hypothetical protein ACI8W8_000454 [Rhodothermales bacterium]|jgi:hypothetical protein